MTKTYAAHQLLRLGPLTVEQFCLITGWRSRDDCMRVLMGLKRDGVVVVSHRTGPKTFEAVA